MSHSVLIPTFTCNILKNRIKLNEVAICKYASMAERRENRKNIYKKILRKREKEKKYKILTRKVFAQQIDEEQQIWSIITCNY